MPNGLVIYADMQKGLRNALAKVYSLAEHREYMRHLFSNFKNHYNDDLFKFGLWGATQTCYLARFNALIDETKKACPSAIQYLNIKHNKL
jgi:hypothetical protein